MKKLFLFLVLPLMTFGQDDPLHTGELITHLTQKSIFKAII